MTERDATAGSGAPKWIVLLLWLIALALAGWTLSGLPLDHIGRSIAALAWTDWILWVALNGALVALATKRWQTLSAALGAPIGFVPLMLVRQAGQAVSFITPGPQFGGEPLQIYLLYRQYAQPLRKAVMALGLDRLYELLVNFSVLLVGVLYLLAQGGAVANWRSIAFGLLALVLMVTALGWLLVRQPQWLTDRWQRLVKRWEQHPRLQKLGGELRASRGIAKTTPKIGKRPLAWALLLSLMVWAALLAELALVLEFTSVPLTLPGFVLIAVAMRLALLLPLPGGIGALEASVLWSFQVLAFPASAAIALIALMRLRDATMLLAGLFSLGPLQYRRLG
ncbi:MAG TPA: lysylphosphatidylglycerol synthase transmembrane domain-containing protein [Steroidobacteraceae bacterium]|nr:lysylphosphatidylglycerol synthase transmembrane domain-containing protein [Steroidobacteraceae bacterium]